VSNKLAIIIPAFKSVFFEKTLQSIVAQTNQNFTLYIGNDFGDVEIKKIIAKYTNQIQINYKEFDNNLGKTSLVSHWSRCVEMISDEKYVWLFSDDDIMGPQCVEIFYKSISQTNKYFDLYRFNVLLIDSTDNIIYNNPTHPDIETSNEFHEMRLGFIRNSYACEYIFNIESFKKHQGFVDFPRAWCSDDATWLKLASETGIKTLQEAKVYWRKSNSNISGDKKDKENKISALKHFQIWCKMQPYLLMDIEILKKQKYWIYRHYFQYVDNVNILDWIKLISHLSELHNDSYYRNLISLLKYIKNNKHIAFNNK
jgi:hypothetical protein